MSPVSELSPKQLRAVSAIARGLSPSQIAKDICVSTRTLERWKKMPQFVAALSQIRGEVSRQVKAEVVEDVVSITSRLENLASKSLNCLGEIVDDRNSRVSDRIQAAKVLISHWQHLQPPVMSEVAALKTLVDAGFLEDSHLIKLQKSLKTLTSECKAIFSADVNQL